MQGRAREQHERGRMTNLFRNSSPGALTREQAVALEKKRLAERRRQKHQAEELAAQGRGGDTEIAHVTPGEIVLPDALQTPAVLYAIRQAALDANIPLERLRVGSAVNSINPHTGQPEFYYSGEDVHQAARPRNPAEQQVADLYISRFPSAAGHMGHVGIGVNSDQTQGFYPIDPDLRAPFGKNFPGEVRNDDMNEPHDMLRIRTSPEQDAAVKAYIENRRTNPGHYDLYNRQCTDFVNGGLRAGNVEIPPDITDTRANEMSPNRFFPLLRNRYGR